MLNRNDLFAGLVFGILLPVLGFILLYQIFLILEKAGLASTAGFSPHFRERTLAIVAIALNLIPLNLFRKRRWEFSMRGVVIATGILAVIWVLTFGVKLF